MPRANKLVWSSGFQSVPSDSGTQFAELNANQVGALYQDIVSVPGQMLLWSLAHRGGLGTDTMQVVVGAPGSNGTVIGTFRDGASAWGHYSGTYVVPAGQTQTRWSFVSVSSAGGVMSVGNFLDSVSFRCDACAWLVQTMRCCALPAAPRR